MRTSTSIWPAAAEINKVVTASFYDPDCGFDEGRKT